jgi:hypothetical protein
MNAIEGREMTAHADVQAVNYIRQRLNDIQGADRARMAMLITQAELAGRSISLKETKSHRRFEIARGLFLLFDSGQFDEDLVKDICSQITSQKYSKPGEALANLDVKQAQRFADACHGIARDLLNLIYIPETNQFHIEEQAS